MSKHTLRAGLALLLFVAAIAGVPASGQGLTAAVEIRLPDGIEPVISIEPGGRIISLVLPRGAQFPLDFAAASRGLIRTGEVTPMGEGHVKLDLILAQGALQRIDYSADGVVMHLGRKTVDLDDRTRATDNYVLGPDDIIRLTVHNQPQLNSKLTVTREGTIFPPLVGETHVARMTPRQVAILLTEKLGQEYLVDPQVDVDVEEFRSQWVMVTGQTQRLGRITLRGGTRLKEVLSEAGGFNQFAGETITISRKVPGSEEYEIETIDRAVFERGEIDPMLYHGDIVDVAHSEYAYIQGEVRSPSRIAIERGLTLMRGIAMVGGLTEWANRKEVRVLYPEKDGKTRVEVYNLRKIQLGKAEDPSLHGGETIIVDRRYF
jgi:polysaccharide export outer membrane protein